MKISNGQFVNEFVSLTVLALMAVALIAGEAGATQSGIEGRVSAVRTDIEIAIDIEGIAALLAGGDDGQRSWIEIRAAGRR